MFLLSLNKNNNSIIPTTTKKATHTEAYTKFTLMFSFPASSAAAASLSSSSSSYSLCLFPCMYPTRESKDSLHFFLQRCRRRKIHIKQRKEVDVTRICCCLCSSFSIAHLASCVLFFFVENVDIALVLYKYVVCSVYVCLFVLWSFIENRELRSK